jgi:hypothetical protein
MKSFIPVYYGREILKFLLAGLRLTLFIRPAWNLGVLGVAEEGQHLAP